MVAILLIFPRINLSNVCSLNSVKGPCGRTIQTENKSGERSDPAFPLTLTPGQNNQHTEI